MKEAYLLPAYVTFINTVGLHLTSDNFPTTQHNNSINSAHQTIRILLCKLLKLYRRILRNCWNCVYYLKYSENCVIICQCSVSIERKDTQDVIYVQVNGTTEFDVYCLSITNILQKCHNKYNFYISKRKSKTKIKLRKKLKTYNTDYI